MPGLFCDILDIMKIDGIIFIVRFSLHVACSRACIILNCNVDLYTLKELDLGEFASLVMHELGLL